MVTKTVRAKLAETETPLYNLEAEQAVLGAMLCDSAALASGIERLVANDFYSPQHRAILSALASLHREGKSPNPILVTDWLQSGGRLDEAGGAAYVTSLLDSVFGSSELEHYVQIVLRHANRRALNAIGIEAQYLSQNGMAPEEVSASMRDKLEAIIARGTIKSTLEKELKCEERGDGLVFSWPQRKITIEFGQMYESSDGLKAEIRVHSVSGGRLAWEKLNLSSGRSRGDLPKKLRASHPEVDWSKLLDHVCYEAAQRFRQGNPTKVLMPVFVTQKEAYLVEKLLPKGEPTVLYGDGGFGKSWVALTLSLAVGTKTGLPGGLTPSEQANVLYLDYESCEADHQDRLAALVAGMGVENYEGQICYRSMTRPLADDASYIRTEIDERKIGLVVVDSFGLACGDEPESAGAATRVFGALRTFAPATSLLVAHVSKQSAELRGEARPYGSVYVRNLARAAWEIRKDGDTDDALIVGLYHNKWNRGRKQSPMSFRFEFSGEGSGSSVRVKLHDIASSADLIQKTPHAYQIKKVLLRGDKTYTELAEETEIAEDSVRSVISRLYKKGEVIPLELRAGRKTWALPSSR